MNTAEAIARLKIIRSREEGHEFIELENCAALEFAIRELQARSADTQAWEAIEKLTARPWAVSILKNKDGYHMCGQSENFPTPQSAALAAAQQEGK